MSMSANDEFSLLKNVPNVLRARGFRLYTQGGRRLTDLWLNGGAAVLGHTMPNMLRELKNTASRGLYAPFPHFTERRFLKALSQLFPNRVFRIFAAPPEELALNIINTDKHGFTRINKEEDGKSGVSIKFWRPYTDPSDPFAADSPLIIAALPGIQSWRNGLPLGLCVIAAASEELLSHLPPNDILPPVLLTMASRGVYNLLASPERGKPALPRVNKALNKSRWRRKGIYLYLKEKPDNDTRILLFNKFLESGFLLPPTPAHPLILPAELSDGEESKLAQLLLE
ncbi:MAG: hypothetical protein FWC03_11355 [Treponema sp.]|nr:hypothetical protein [Treponema sp.]